MANNPNLQYEKADIFSRVATWSTHFTGGRWGFLLALLSIVIWAVTGPVFQFSQNWQLVINTMTNLVTFLMVFLIQNAQNRESKAIHLKLDELIRAVKTAKNEMIDIENLTERNLDVLTEEYRKIAAEPCEDRTPNKSTTATQNRRKSKRR